MRKLFLFLLSAVLVLSSCSYSTSIISGVKENPFADTYQITDSGPAKTGLFNPVVPPEEGGSGEGEETVTPPSVSAMAEPAPLPSGGFSFVMFADPHIGRSDSGVTEHTEEFLRFLDDNPGAFQFAVCLGDLIDNGDIYSNEGEAFIEAVGERTKGNFIYVLGNHDIHSHSGAEWDEQFHVLVSPDKAVTRMMRYSYGGVSFYKLDNSTRVMGKEQLRWLEDALKKDPNSYRIFLAHEVVTTGGELDQTLFLFGMEAGESMNLYRIMRDNGVSMIFTGHHHKGNITYEFDDFSEFNAAALHERTTSFSEFESRGYWYTVNINPDTEKLTLTTYVVTDDAVPYEICGTAYFDLVAADAAHAEEPDEGGEEIPDTGTDEGGDETSDEGGSSALS